MIRKEAVIAILGSPVAYYTAFVRVLGGVEAGIMTSQFFYWYGKGHNPDGWIYKTQAEIEEETGLTRRNQETARKKLRELGVLEERYAGMPAKLYYRLNLDELFKLMNAWFSTAVLQEEIVDEETEEDPRATLQDVQTRHPRMYKPAIQGSANPPSKDVQTRHPGKRESAIQESANPPSMHGGIRHTNTKITTETTTEITTETTTSTNLPTVIAETPVDVTVAVLAPNLPTWILEEFQLLLGSKRTANAADQTALAELCGYPDHIIQQALDAAHTWLCRPNQKPIHSLSRWLVGTAQRKWEAELTRGNTVNFPADKGTYVLDYGVEVEEEEESEPTPHGAEPGLLTPQAQIWHTVLQELALQMPSATYNAWLRDTVVVMATDDEYGIGLPNAQAKAWLENRLIHTIRRTLASFVGHPVTVTFHVPQSEGT